VSVKAFLSGYRLAMPDVGDGAIPEPGSTRDQAPDPESGRRRVNRELIELLTELRIAIPGVQVLFAFLLTVPFTSRFRDITHVQRVGYYLALLSAAMASVLLTAPSAYHRMRFRRQDKEQMLVTSNRLAIAGLVFLALSMIQAVFVTADVIFGRTIAVVSATGGVVTIGWFWFGLPLSRR